MLFVHFTPVKNVSHIKRLGIVPHHGAISLFPMVMEGKRLINCWSGKYWWRQGTAQYESKMAKIVVWLPPGEKVKFGDWCTVSSKGEMTVRELGKFIHAEIRRIKKMIDNREFDELKDPFNEKHLEMERNFFEGFRALTGTPLEKTTKPRNVQKDYAECLSFAYYFGGAEVNYGNVIPTKWIRNIFVDKRSGRRIRRYVRARNKKELRRVIYDSE